MYVYESEFLELQSYWPLIFFHSFFSSKSTIQKIWSKKTVIRLKNLNPSGKKKKVQKKINLKMKSEKHLISINVISSADSKVLFSYFSF